MTLRRRFRTPGFLLAWLVLVLPGAGASARAGETDSPSDPASLSFERDVRPILKEHCFHCHGEEPKLKSGLDLRFVQTMLDGGLTGEAIVPGDLDGSFLWHRIDADEMPPGDAKLSSEQKATIAAWIDAGAPTLRPEPEEIPPPGEMVLTQEDAGFWSFQPIQRPDVPVVEADASLVRTPLDAFLLDRLHDKGLSFGPEADRTTFIRRASMDLLGLPPTPEEVADFLADDAPDAVDRLIDRLLESPHYGERWARHWMDVAGYADSDGYTLADPVRPWAYRYRDYLIRAFNADRPWDDLIVEQLAGDELVAPPYEQLGPEDLDRLIATGFLRMAPDGTADGEVDPVVARNDAVAETIKVVSTAFLGLTVGCAQCHSHRYDPISHEDYFRFRALFEPALDVSDWKLPNARLISLWTDADREQAKAAAEALAQVNTERSEAINDLVNRILEKELEAAPEELRQPLREARDLKPADRSEEQVELLRTYPRVLVTSGNVSLYDAKAYNEITAEFAKRTAAVEPKRPADNYVHALTEIPGKVPTTHLFLRGDPNQPAEEVDPGELTILTVATGSPDIPIDDPNLPTTGRRLAYARHLTGGEHPLVSRVLVNRIWMHHFGRGLVASTGDFGVLGDRPSHPDLLDWLADDFMQGGWTLKRLHRMIMTSTAYRQVSTRRPELDAIDPENVLLGRQNVRRLEAEVVRDAILATSGTLNPEAFGPSVPVAPDEAGRIIVGKDNRDSAGRPSNADQSLGNAALRRTLYVQIRRTMPLGLTESFDPPDLSPSCPQRDSSTVAPQSLMLMNNPFVLEQSEAMADRVIASAGDDPSDRIRLAWQLAFAREPDAEQVAGALDYLDRQRSTLADQLKADDAEAETKPDPDRLPLASFCHALLCSNGFLYVD
ncbi:PSD1 and planctomycete cytochrome C domain-containing protein [Tautonia rosea]|uniref:PSD1 and planctomycete cytochrome C domain-containing protein n=1 Tax=Tautonia rosea TaxID=2728037 RepID=UPI001473F779|nr:PSD1 and planctomycete cytochrome C domain-containing protein [Tautonia rosea]